MTPAQLTPNPLPDEDDAETPQAPEASDADAPTPTKDAPPPTDEDAAPCVEIDIELPQLQEKRRVDGVGRAKFDFHTGGPRESNKKSQALLHAATKQADKRPPLAHGLLPKPKDHRHAQGAHRVRARN